MKRQLQFLIYRSAWEDISVDAVIRDESIWLTQKAMSELFEVQTPAVSVHAPGRKQQLFVYVKANLALLDVAQDAVGHIPQNSGA